MMSFRLGDVTVARVVEIPRSFYPTTAMLPDSTVDAIARHHRWLKPHFFDEATGDLRSVIQSWIVRTPRHTVLIDTGVGNDKPREHAPLWHRRHGTYLDDLAAAGVRPDDVDVVLCTHLHVDHVGWNTRQVDGRWVPTFPRASYLFVGEEFEFWRHESAAAREEWGCIDDSVLLTVPEVLAEPQTAALGLLGQAPETDVPLVSLPFAIDRRRPAVRRRPPRLGEHNPEIL
jgi:glyoxylase-like metal-dependent hydrolase (beta-lactamase superfamily II)